MPTPRQGPAFNQVTQKQFSISIPAVTQQQPLDDTLNWNQQLQTANLGNSVKFNLPATENIIHSPIQPLLHKDDIEQAYREGMANISQLKAKCAGQQAELRRRRVDLLSQIGEYPDEGEESASERIPNTILRKTVGAQDNCLYQTPPLKECLRNRHQKVPNQKKNTPTVLPPNFLTQTITIQIYQESEVLVRK